VAAPYRLLSEPSDSFALVPRISWRRGFPALEGVTRVKNGGALRLDAVVGASTILMAKSIPNRFSGFDYHDKSSRPPSSARCRVGDRIKFKCQREVFSGEGRTMSAFSTATMQLGVPRIGACARQA
jgi:hypothetical protein